jgi:hypothetical protein
MKPKRTGIPKATREAVLQEYRHRCAVCGEANPQLHHIDEDRTNHSTENLLPLCPNCHLSDQHNPTSKHDPRKIALFRKYKDPAILRPQFQAIFDRIAFLYVLEDLHTQHRLSEEINDLVHFVSGMKMGEYYSKKIKKLLVIQAMPIRDASILISLPDEASQERIRERRQIEHAHEKEWARIQREYFLFVDDEVLRLLVESLRFQEWK